MKKRIRLIWDFRGPAAEKTAQHHEIHLKQYSATINLNKGLAGSKRLNDVHSIAYLIVDESEMIKVRDALKPHRGEIYEEISPGFSNEGK